MMNRSRKKLPFTIELKESFWMALNAIRAHKLRSSLTLLGIAIGVFSIIVVMTALQVLQANIEKSLSEFSTDTFVIQRWPGLEFGGPGNFDKYRKRKNLLYDQGLALKERASLAKNVGMENDFHRGVAESKYAKTNPNTQLYGMTPEAFPAKGLNVEEGRGLLDLDESNSRYSCVIGANTAKILFPRGSPLNQLLKIDGIKYQVVGVCEAKGQMQGGDQDNFVIVPLNTALNYYGRLRGVRIMVQTQTPALYEDTMEQTRGILRKIRKVPPGEDDDFEVFSNDTLIERFNGMTLMVRLGAMVISSIALLTAGIGIMNIMLVSVTERTREIGIRRAIGAKRRNIMAQFITEAVVLCQIGGVIGVLMGILGGNGTAIYFKMPPVIPYDWAMIGMGVCSLVGIVFGTYPAYKAAHLNPIDSLRYE